MLKGYDYRTYICTTATLSYRRLTINVQTIVKYPGHASNVSSVEALAGSKASANTSACAR